MKLENWDAEFAVISSDLQAVKLYQHDTQQRDRLALIALKIAIFQLQGHLSVVLDRLQTATQRKAMLGARQHSLLQWAAYYGQRAEQYYFAKIHVLGKHMWLKLLRQRMPGIASAPLADFSDENLIELSVRHKQLSETEKLLRMRVSEIEAEKGALKHQYEDICAIKANRDAASTMSTKFGRNLLEAGSNPILGRVKGLLNNLAIAARPLSDRYHYLRDLHHTIATQTDQLIQHCRGLVIDEIAGPQKVDDRVRQREYDASLRKIEELRNQLELANELFSTTPPPAHPIMVQSNPNQATTL